MTKTEFIKQQAAQLQFYNDIWEVLTLDSLILKTVSNYLEHSTTYKQIKGGCQI